MIGTPDKARSEWPCPLSRLWGEEAVNPNCRADGCPVWRWVPLKADTPEFKAAVSDAIREFGGGPVNHKKAVEFVMQNRDKLGLPSAPVVGFCGLGGKPE